jgi:hypothetical protein
LDWEGGVEVARCLLFVRSPQSILFYLTRLIHQVTPRDVDRPAEANHRRPR